MKEKDIINGEELETINSELFGSFDPEDESWIVGGSKTTSSSVTYTPTGPDGGADFDAVFAEMEEVSAS
jgi:hypothetical protein